MESKYAILNCKTKLHLFNKELPPDNVTNEMGGEETDQIWLEAGTTVQIFQMNNHITSKKNDKNSKDSCVVKILDYANNSVIYENLYVCPLNNLENVCESLWPYIISIIEPYERLQMVQNGEHCEWILNVKLNDSVKVLGEMLNHPKTTFTCMVRYIGPVPELYPVGYFFGLELQDLKYNYLLPKEKMQFSAKYLSQPEYSIYATANFIRSIDTEKKSLTRDFIAGTFEKVVSAISPASALVSGYTSQCQNVGDSINCDNQIKNFKKDLPTKIEDESIKRRTIQTQTQYQPSGILKYKRNPTVNMKTHTADRDIVIISENDISPDGEVIVLEKSQLNDKDYNILRKDQKDSESATNSEIIKKSKMPSPTTYQDATITSGINNNEVCLVESPFRKLPETSLGIGSLVEVYTADTNTNLYGVIRWIGIPPGAKEIMVGVELEDDNNDKSLLTTNGTFNGIPLFKCRTGRALFVTSNQCSCDRRFNLSNDDNDGERIVKNKLSTNDSEIFGQVDCPIVPGAFAPLKCITLIDLEHICGKFKGIQGHHNSCYLDVTLFAMFTFTTVFDSILFRSPNIEDISNYDEVQRVLREEIVNPLRKHVFVRADRVMKLRQLLDKLSSIDGLTSEEKDPEEFLNCLLSQIMKAEPFLKLSSGQDAYYYQLFVEKDDRLVFPSVQELFEQSFYASDIKLKEVPSCLIIQMPRFGKNYKMYSRILPSQVLDITDIIENSPRQCTVCGKLAEYECRDCFGTLQSGSGLECTAFCSQCLQTVHNHDKRLHHTSRKLSIPQDFCVMVKNMSVPRLYMELFAVVCIETSHYVTFVKSSSGPDAPWCFFDSMADRKGEQNGYNIPEIVSVPDLPNWLSEDGSRRVHETTNNDKLLPEHAKRLFCDAYMCMYQSTDVMMYR